MRDLVIGLFSGTAHFLKMNHEAERDEAKQNNNLDLDEELSLYQRQRWEIKTLFSQSDKILARCIESVRKRTLMKRPQQP